VHLHGGTSLNKTAGKSSKGASHELPHVIHKHSIINMINLQEIVAALADCNLHFCLYIAFGIMFVLRGALGGAKAGSGEAREDVLHGLVYLILGLLL
jgi:hypothetical protein